MLYSLALILLIAMILNAILVKIKLPGLLGMIATGILLGPYVLNLISSDILTISSDLRKIALIVILLRAGLSLDLNDLKKVGRPAILMCFIPATLEIGAITALAPLLLNISYIEGAILGAVVAAVSPAVVVPRMIQLIDKGYGKKHSIPQLIMAGASVDDIYVIVLFASFMDLYDGAAFNFMSLLNVPISIITGIAFGIIIGLMLIRLFKKVHMRDTIKVLIILSASFVIIYIEELIKPVLPLSGLLAIMALGGTILAVYQPLAVRLKAKFGKVWVGAEIILFVLVGAAVDISYVPQAGIAAIVILICALAARMVGVGLSVAGTKLTPKERLFSALAYLPKATVQAAIGSIPLSRGVEAGNTILVVAVMAIILTAPIGALGIDRTYKQLLDGPKEA